MPDKAIVLPAEASIPQLPWPLRNRKAKTFTVCFRYGQRHSIELVLLKLLKYGTKAHKIIDIDLRQFGVQPLPMRYSSKHEF
jgi:7-cyano-7-deazaguanine synthase in queuosine biosynthesis